LLPYAEEHLRKLDEAEQAFRDALNRVEDQVNRRQAPDFPYAPFNAAGQAEKERLFDQYLAARIKEDPELRKLQEALRRERPVVSVALDLGVVLLRRAQGMADPDARRRELEKAEKMFLAIRGQAGQSSEYRLRLGQDRKSVV